MTDDILMTVDDCGERDLVRVVITKLNGLKGLEISKCERNRMT
jgi:hypothetical protein